MPAVFLYPIILLLGFFAFTFLGYIFHWAFHRPWSGIFYKKHWTHHFTHYPPNNLFSEEYIYTKADNSVVLFAILFAPFVAAVFLITIFHIIPYILGTLLLIEMGIIGWANTHMHDSFHLHKSFWSRFWFYDDLVVLHMFHHYDTKNNLGIFWFGWDRVFGTLKKSTCGRIPLLERDRSKRKSAGYKDNGEIG